MRNCDKKKLKFGSKVIIYDYNTILKICKRNNIVFEDMYISDCIMGKTVRVLVTHTQIIKWYNKKVNKYFDNVRILDIDGHIQYVPLIFIKEIVEV